mgnify:CR=1 FL=1
MASGERPAISSASADAAASATVLAVFLAGLAAGYALLRLAPGAPTAARVWLVAALVDDEGGATAATDVLSTSPAGAGTPSRRPQPAAGRRSPAASRSS